MGQRITWQLPYKYKYAFEGHVIGTLCFIIYGCFLDLPSSRGVFWHLSDGIPTYLFSLLTLGFEEWLVSIVVVTLIFIGIGTLKVGGEDFTKMKLVLWNLFMVLPIWVVMAVNYFILLTLLASFFNNSAV